MKQEVHGLSFAPFLKGTGRVAVTVLLTWLIFRGLGLQLGQLFELDLAVLRPQPIWLLVSVVLLWAGFSVSAWLWRGLVVALGGPPVPLREAVAVVLLANLGRYVPGKVWQLAGLAYLSAKRGIEPRVAGIAAVSGQVFHLAGAALVGGILTLEYLNIPFGIGGGLGLLAFFGLAVLAETALFRNLLYRLAGAQTDDDPLPGLQRGFALRWLVPYTMNWFLLGLAFHTLCLGLGFDLPLPVSVAGFAAAYLVGYLILVAPAGIGVREGVLVALIQPHVGPNGAIALASAQRVWITAAEALGAGLGWVLLPRTNDSGKEPKTNVSEGAS